MNKKLAAFGAAALMTACSAAAMMAIGGFAVLNRSGAAPANSAAQASKLANASMVSQSQVQQLQGQISQYQARDQEYQAREQQLQQALSQAQTQLQADQQQFQQFQMLLFALQQRGFIRISGDGGIVISNGGGD